MSECLFACIKDLSMSISECVRVCLSVYLYKKRTALVCTCIKDEHVYVLVRACMKDLNMCMS